ncbi:hypothetical protein D3C73_1410490 [compost metagenome]
MQTQRIDIFPEQPPALDAVFDEERHTTAARKRLQTNRARSGKNVQNARAVQTFRIGVA